MTARGLPINHFQDEKLPVSTHKTPYDSNPEVIGLEFPAAHIMGIRTACSSYVKNIDSVNKKAGTIHASASPRKKRTTKRDAKLLHGTCSSKMEPLLGLARR